MLRFPPIPPIPTPCARSAWSSRRDSILRGSHDQDSGIPCTAVDSNLTQPTAGYKSARSRHQFPLRLHSSTPCRLCAHMPFARLAILIFLRPAGCCPMLDVLQMTGTCGNATNGLGSERPAGRGSCPYCTTTARLQDDDVYLGHSRTDGAVPDNHRRRGRLPTVSPSIARGFSFLTIGFTLGGYL